MKVFFSLVVVATLSLVGCGGEEDEKAEVVKVTCECVADGGQAESVEGEGSTKEVAVENAKGKCEAPKKIVGECSVKEQVEEADVAETATSTQQ